MSDQGERIDPRTAATELLAGRYPGATAIFLAGSCARGTETASSDLDITVLFGRLEGHPIREAYLYKGWPVDASSGDEESLVRMMASSPQKGECTVPTLIWDAVVLPGATPLTDALQRKAKAIIDAGPAPLSPRDQQIARFTLTYLRTKLQSPRADDDLLSLGAMLHTKLGHFYLRANRRWSGTPTSMARRLREEDPVLARRIFDAFHALFARSECAPVSSLIEEILAPHGGLLFDGFRDVRDPAQPLPRRPLG